MHRSVAVLAVTIVALVTGSGSSALAVSDRTWPKQLSGGSPFADCAPGAIDDRKADGAIEPQLAADPSRPQRMVAVWPQDRQRGVVIAVTDNGGASWRRSVVPGLTRCSGGRYDYVDDPTATFTVGGDLVVAGSLTMADRSASAATSVHSSDGGRTWAAPAVIAEETDPVTNGGVLAGAIAADPHDPEVLYAVTPRFPVQERSRNHANISHSTDGGRSWGPARLMVDAGERHIASGHRLTVLGDGTLLDVYSLVDFRTSPSTKTLRAVRSTDSGLSWTAPIPVADLRTKFLFQDPESGEQVSHTTSLLGDTGLDPRTGRLYVAWQDSRFTDGAVDSIALASSADGGLTWSEPVKVNRTPSNIPSGNQQAFTVSLDVARDGTLAISHSDFRHNDARAPLFTDRWLLRCHPQPAGCADQAAFWRETRLTANSFDMRQAPRIPDETSPRGYFLGEQMGLIATGHRFASVWAQPAEPGRAAVHATTTG